MFNLPVHDGSFFPPETADISILESRIDRMIIWESETSARHVPSSMPLLDGSLLSADTEL